MLPNAKNRKVIVSFISSSLLLGAWRDEDQSGAFKQYLAYTSLPIPKSKHSKRQLKMSWISDVRGSDCEVSSILPIELEMVVVGFSGHIHTYTHIYC